MKYPTESPPQRAAECPRLSTVVVPSAVRAQMPRCPAPHASTRANAGSPSTTASAESPRAASAAGTGRGSGRAGGAATCHVPRVVSR